MLEGKQIIFNIAGSIRELFWHDNLWLKVTEEYETCLILLASIWCWQTKTFYSSTFSNICNLTFSFLSEVCYFYFQAATHLSSLGWVDPVPDPNGPNNFFLGFSLELYLEFQTWQRGTLTVAIYIYTRWPCHASLWHCVAAWMRNNSFPKTTVLTLLSVVIFYISPFPTLHTGARGVHKRHQGYNYLYHRIQNSYQLFQNHDSTLFFYFVYMSPLPTLAHTIAKGSGFSISSFFDVIKLQQNCLDVSSTGSFPFPMSMSTHILIPYHPYSDGGLNLESLFIAVFPKTVVSTLLSVNVFIGRPSFIGARGARKRLHGCNYSYHRVQNSKIFIRH